MPVIYEICVSGHLDPQWSDWMDEMTITPLENGESLLSGPLADQAALFGLLIKINNLGMTLVSIVNVQSPT